MEPDYNKKPPLLSRYGEELHGCMMVILFRIIPIVGGVALAFGALYGLLLALGVK